MARKKKNLIIRLQDLIEIGAPDLYFSVQQALQNENVLLIDLGTGTVIRGQVNTPEIGLISQRKPLKTVRQMGFVQSNSLADLIHKKQNIEAVLSLDLASQDNKDSLYLQIQVIDEADLELWKEISITVGLNFVYEIKGKPLPEVIFRLSPLSRSTGEDTSASDAALRKIQRYGSDDTSAISGYSLMPDNDEGDDDYEGDDSEI